MLKLSLPLRLVLSAVLNSILAWGLDAFLPAYVTIFGGVGAFVIIGSLLTLMNFLVRPVLQLVSLPFKLIATLLTLIVVNGFFLLLVYQIALQMDPNIIVLTITGGLAGWIVVALVLGIASWLMKHIL